MMVWFCGSIPADSADSGRGGNHPTAGFRLNAYRDLGPLITAGLRFLLYRLCIEESASFLASQLVSVARRTVAGPIIGKCYWIMVCTNRVTSVHLQPTQRTVQHAGPTDWQPPQGSLRAGGGRVDQQPAPQ